MPITPWKSLWEARFPSLKEEMDKLFEDFFGKAGFPMREEGWVPAVDIHETKKDVIVTMDIPSIDPKEVTVLIVDDRLTIKGEKKRDLELKDEDCYRSERVYGTFQRVIQLPAEVVADKAKATYMDGVLKIIMPKSHKTVPKEIKVEIQ